MRNDTNSKIKTIFDSAKKLPVFSLDDLASVETDRHYLRVLLSRYEKTGKTIRLKKGLYVSKEYLDELGKRGLMSAYLEFLACMLYAPSYLSMEYVLHEHGMLTDMPVAFTSATTKKTASISNALGTFRYHTLRDDLYSGYELTNVGDFSIAKATKSKALFDFLYLRKHIIVHKESFDELRLNLENFTVKDKEEFLDYAEKEKSLKMKIIYGYILS